MFRKGHYHSLNLILIAALFLSCSTAPSMDLNDCAVIFTDNDNGMEKTVDKNKTFCIKLTAKLSTGYGWQLEKSSSNIKPDGQPATVAKKMGVIGGVEYQTFRFKAEDSGSGELSMLYKKPWLKEEAPAKNYRLKIIVRQ